MDSSLRRVLPSPARRILSSTPTLRPFDAPALLRAGWRSGALTRRRPPGRAGTRRPCPIILSRAGRLGAMASDVPVLLSDAQVRLDPCADPYADPYADPSQDPLSASTSTEAVPSTLCWSVRRLGSHSPIGALCLAADPSPHRRRLTLSWAEEADAERGSANDVQTMSQAVRLACRWAF